MLTAFSKGGAARWKANDVLSQSFLLMYEKHDETGCNKYDLEKLDFGPL